MAARYLGSLLRLGRTWLLDALPMACSARVFTGLQLRCWGVTVLRYWGGDELRLWALGSGER